MTVRLRGCPCPENPELSKARIEEDKYDYSSDDEILVEYDRTVLFPLTRWMQMNRNEEITHEKLDEFNKVAAEVQSEFITSHDSEHAMDIWDSVVHPVEGTILHLWDVRGELRPWIIKEACKVLIGTNSSYELPEARSNAFKREQKYRGGMSSVEMALANLGNSVLGVSKENKAFSDEDIEEANETDQGVVDYEHSIEQYFVDEDWF